MLVSFCFSILLHSPCFQDRFCTGKRKIRFVMQTCPAQHFQLSYLYAAVQFSMTQWLSFPRAIIILKLPLNCAPADGTTLWILCENLKGRGWGKAACTCKPGCCPNTQEASNWHCFSQCLISVCVVEYCQAVNHQGNQGGCFSCFWAYLPNYVVLFCFCFLIIIFIIIIFCSFFNYITTELINSKIEYQVSKSHSLYAVF